MIVDSFAFDSSGHKNFHQLRFACHIGHIIMVNESWARLLQSRPEFLETLWSLQSQLMIYDQSLRDVVPNYKSVQIVIARKVSFQGFTTLLSLSINIWTTIPIPDFMEGEFQSANTFKVSAINFWIKLWSVKTMEWRGFFFISVMDLVKYGGLCTSWQEEPGLLYASAFARYSSL